MEMFQNDFMPHGSSLSGEPWLIWSSAISDFTFAIAYVALALALVTLVRRRPDIPFPRMISLFALFLVLSGVTHFLEAVTLWTPLYHVAIGSKVVTAVVLLVGAVIIGPLSTTMSAIPSQRELQKTKDSLATAQRIAGLGSWEWTVATGALAWSEEFYRIFGQDSTTFIPTYEGFLGTVHPEDRERVKQAVERAVAGDAGYLITHRIIRPNGEERIIEEQGEVERDEGGNPIRMVGVGHDITERVQRENELKEYRLLLEKMFDSLNEAVIVVTPDRQLQKINKTTVQMFGYTFEELKEQSTALLHVDDDHFIEFGRRIKEAFSRNEAANFTFELKRKNGEVFPTDHTVTLLRDEEGAPTAHVSVIRDITERKRSDDALNAALKGSEKLRAAAEKAMQEAEAANKAKSDFLANMSHELRTPLNGIIGITEILLDGDVAGQQRKQLALVKSSGDTLLSLVNDVLDLARIEAGRFDLRHETFALVELVEETAARQAALAHVRGVELIVSVGDDLPPFVVGDASRLQQVIVNLLGNAIKFTHQGEVELNVQVDEEDDETATLHFFIRDTGIGIPKEKLATIFQRFTQGDESVTRQYGGAGLGTTIAQQFVELMGGTIWVESVVGEGTTSHFTVRLQKGFHTEECAPIPLEELKTLRVLIVDDNEANRIVLRDVIATWGMEFVEAENGADAIEQIGLARQRHERFDVILMDYDMPGYNGVEASRMIRTSSKANRPLIILLSSVMGGVEERLSEAGIDGFITKPIRRSALLNMILTGLGKASAIDAVGGKNDPRIPTSRTISILLVEDNEVNREVAAYALKPIDHTLDFATNGDEGVTKWRTGAYDLILMDVHMPVMDGLEATRTIRDEESRTGRRHTSIIAMTARAMEQDRLDCLAAGMDDYLAKPIKKADLLAKVAAHLHMSFAETKTGERGIAKVSLGYDLSSMRVLVGNDEESLKMLVRRFLTATEGELSGLLEAIRHGDLLSVERVAHSVKGNLAQLGAAELAKIAYQLETKGRKRELEGVRALWDKLASAFPKLSAALIKELG